MRREHVSAPGQKLLVMLFESILSHCLRDCCDHLQCPGETEVTRAAEVTPFHPNETKPH